MNGSLRSPGRARPTFGVRGALRARRAPDGLLLRWFGVALGARDMAVAVAVSTAVAFVAASVRCEQRRDVAGLEADAG